MKYDVSGKSFTDIMNISIKELESMSRSDVAKVTSRLVSVANKRIRRMERSGFKIKNIRFSINALEKEDILQEFKFVKNFLNDKRYSIRGQKEIIKKINQKLEEKGYKKIKSSELFWDIYDRLIDESKLFEKFNLKCVELDFDDDEEEVEKLNVGKTLPVCIIIKDGKEKTRIIGEKSLKELEDLIEII